MPSLRIGRRGQITIPRALRRELRLEEGGHVMVILRDGELVLRPVAPTEVSEGGAGDATEGVSDGGLLFVDTNVFLRFLTNDVPDQAAAAEALFRRAAAGEVGLVTNAMVLAELVWVLESYYHLARPDVQERAMAVACMDGLSLPEIDAYNANWTRQRGLKRIVTFGEKRHSRLEGIEAQDVDVASAKALLKLAGSWEDERDAVEIAREIRAGRKNTAPA